MLVLSRKENESIIISENIEVRIARIEADKVKVGITAPRSIPIYRKELAPFSDHNFGNAEEPDISRVVLGRV